MAGVITLSTLAIPANFTVVAAAGGSLPDATTYYVRAFASDGSSFDGAWTAELSATTNSGAGLNSIQVQFDDVAGASKYFVVITKVSGDYRETVKHCVSAYGLASSEFLLTAESQINYYCWYRPSGAPNIYIDGGSALAPLSFEDIYLADVAAGWNRVLHEQVVNNVEYVLGNALSNSYVIDANLKLGYNSDTYFKQTKASISLMGRLQAAGLNLKLFQLGDRAGAGRGGRYGCELLVRTGRGLCQLSADETNLYDSSITGCSANEPGWDRTPFGWYNQHTWLRENLNLGKNGAYTTRIIGCKISGFWSTVTLCGDTAELNWDTFCGPLIALSGRALFENLTFLEINHTAMKALGGCTFSKCESIYGCCRDIYWGNQYPADPHTHFVDCAFNSQNQGANDPYGCWRDYSKVGDDDLLFEHRFNPIFVDADGNLLSGFTVVLIDKDSGVIINDTTGADGRLSGGGVDVVNRKITCDAGSVGLWYNYLSWMVAQGYYIENVRNPHTLTVSKDGTDYLVAVVNIEAKMESYIIVNTSSASGDASANIEEFEKLRLGTTLYRDWRIRGAAVMSSALAAIAEFETLVWQTTRFRDYLVRAGRLDT